jgi:hypothetical protein
VPLRGDPASERAAPEARPVVGDACEGADLAGGGVREVLKHDTPRRRCNSASAASKKATASRVVVFVTDTVQARLTFAQ